MTAVSFPFPIPSVAKLFLSSLLIFAGCTPSSTSTGEATQNRPAVEDSTSANNAEPEVPAIASPTVPNTLIAPPALPRLEPSSTHIASAIAHHSNESSFNRDDVVFASESQTPSNPLRDDEVRHVSSDMAIVSNDASEDTLPHGFKRRVGNNGGKPFDPIEVNGPIFEGWSKPKFALVITGMEQGYIEPCGCAGLERMKGGMARRFTLLKELREKGWPIVGLDVGGIARGFGLESVFKFQRMVDGKRQMGYGGIGLGVDDLQLPAEDLLATISEVDGQPSPFVSANVGLFELNGGMPATSRIIEVGGVKIGVTSILGDQYQKNVRNQEIKMVPAKAALQKIVPGLKKQANYLVLLANAPLNDSIALGKAFPEFNVVVTSDSPPEPPKTADPIEGTKTVFIRVGRKGEDAIVLGRYDDPASPWRYQRVPLDSRFASAPEMKTLMSVFQDQLKTIGFKDLGLHAAAHPLAAQNGRFVGSKKCESCHEISYSIWKKSGHSQAYDSLAQLDPARNFDPECISCHVIGWHPSKFFPYESGYESQEKTPHLTNVGCEDCHGPGEKHVAVETSGSETDRLTFRKAMRLTKADAEKQQCTTCHDGDNSPFFDFKEYWPFIEHKEKE